MTKGRTYIARARGALTGTAPWGGRVLSVHSRAINILRADGLAVSVVADPSAMSVMGILADDLFATSPEVTLVNTAVRMEAGVISIGNLISNDCRVFIECARCPLCEGVIDAASVRMIPVERIRAVRDYLLTWGKPGGLIGILRNGTTENAFASHGRNSLRDGRPENLVGCGPGLTPAGDDFLTGAMLASLDAEVFDRGRLERALPGTTPMGRTLVWAALQDRFPAYLVDFIDAVSGAAVSADALSTAVRAACAHGETSGTDALAGFCWQKLHGRRPTKLRGEPGSILHH
jgi:hypothetical protein